MTYESFNVHKWIYECVNGCSTTAKQIFAFFDVGTKTNTIWEKTSNEHLCLVFSEQLIPITWNLANSYLGFDEYQMCGTTLS